MSNDDSIDLNVGCSSLVWFGSSVLQNGRAAYVDMNEGAWRWHSAPLATATRVDARWLLVRLRRIGEQNAAHNEGYQGPVVIIIDPACRVHVAGGVRHNINSTTSTMVRLLPHDGF